MRIPAQDQRFSHRPEIRAALDWYARQVGTLVGDRLVHLCVFGSYSRGTARPESDVDVAVVVRDLTREETVRLRELCGDASVRFRGAPLSSWVVSEQHFKMLENREQRIALDVLREGLPL